MYLVGGLDEEGLRTAVETPARQAGLLIEPGLVDLLSLPEGPRRTAIVHMSINLVVVALFAINIWMRVRGGGEAVTSNAPVWLSVLAVGLLVVSGWLGGKLVYEHGVAVDTESVPGERRR